MKIPLWVHETAALFWEAAGALEAFPRALRQPILRSPFELTIKEVPGLSTAVVARFLARIGPGWHCGAPERTLRACLAARDGAGFILLDADDTSAERTFSLAHELAHFLWHYWRPRQRAESQLGNRALAVFDGQRVPSTTERLRALLSNVPLGPHLHLMERGQDRDIVNSRVAMIEEEADQLAYELLAPVADVTAGNDPARLIAELMEVFGLPRSRAEDYSHVLSPAAIPDPLIQRLRGKR
jgi:hypothetical protein